MRRIISSSITKSSKGTSSCTKAQNLQVGKFVKKFNPLTWVSAQRGIPMRRGGTLKLLEMQQLSRTSNHTARVTKYLGEGGADQVNRIFRQNPSFSDPRLVKVVVREMLMLQSIQFLATQKLGQASGSKSPTGGGPAPMTLARTRRRTEDCDEPVGENGDADEREAGLGSSRRTLQVELESEFKAITLSRERRCCACLA